MEGKYLRENYPKIYFSLVKLINASKKITQPYSIYITDSLGGSFKDYFITSDMTARISALKRGLDNESVDTIDVIMQRLLNYPDERYKHRIPERKEVIGGLLPVETEQSRAIIEREMKIRKRNLKFPSGHIEESVFYFYHGLFLLPFEIRKYVTDQDFIDAGAFIGDSAIALAEYKYRKIYSIEMSLKSVERYRINLANCGISSDKYEIINTGIASNDDEPPVKLHDTGSSGLSFLRRTGKYDEISVEKKSLDFLVDKYGISPRFIKADIEGNGIEFVEGARKTLVRYRPVLSIAVYHNPREFFEIKPILEDLLPEYKFMVRKLAAGIKNNLCHSEVVLLGYPAEIAK